MNRSLLFLLMAGASEASARDAAIYVSPTGRDCNPGAQARPLASVGASKARGS